MPIFKKIILTLNVPERISAVNPRMVEEVEETGEGLPQEPAGLLRFVSRSLNLRLDGLRTEQLIAWI